MLIKRKQHFPQACNHGGRSTHLQNFSSPLEKCVERSCKILDIVLKIWASLRKLFATLVSQVGYGPDFPCQYRIKLVYDFIKVSFLLFRPFLFSSKLYHITFPDLLLINEAQRYERTSFSLLKDRLQLAVNTV